MSLKKAGHRALYTDDAEQARKTINSVLPDLVPLDWMLPHISRLEFARKLRREERTKAIPIIMPTDHIQESDKISRLEAGADDYVTQPFHPGSCSPESKLCCAAAYRKCATILSKSAGCSWIRRHTACGAITCLSRIAPLTCTSADCAKFMKKIWCKLCAAPVTGFLSNAGKKAWNKQVISFSRTSNTAQLVNPGLQVLQLAHRFNSSFHYFYNVLKPHQSLNNATPYEILCTYFN